MKVANNHDPDEQTDRVSKGPDIGVAAKVTMQQLVPDEDKYDGGKT